MPEFSFEENRGRVWENREDAVKDLKRMRKRNPRYHYQILHLAGGGWVVRARDSEVEK